METANRHQPDQHTRDEPEPNGFSGRFFTYPTGNGELRELAGSIALLVVSLAVFAALNPYERPIPYQLLNDGEYVLNLSHNLAFDGDTVSSGLLFVLSGILPLCLQLGLCVYFGRAKGRDVHATLCTYLVAFGLNSLATNAVKLYVGYLRPSFYQLCQPDDNYETCTNEDTGVSADARESFPSGHASYSFTGLTLLTLFLHTRFGIRSVRQVEQRIVTTSRSPEDRRSTVQWTMGYTTPLPGLYRLISILSLAPMALALFIAASRVRNNKHFPADVVGGSVLGAAVALFTYQLWFDDAHNYAVVTREVIQQQPVQRSIAPSGECAPETAVANAATPPENGGLATTYDELDP